MKRFFISLTLATLLIALSHPAWSQASTEGKDFWVANTIVCQPPTASDPAFPTIAVSAQKACKVTITDYAGNPLATANVAAGSWTRFGDNNAAIDPADYYLDPSKWYPSTNNINATDVWNHADKINNYGLHITATENVSVYVIMGTPQYSMDACNALPITALQSEYYLQDFYPYSKDVSKCVTMTTILATENGTKVDITPKGNTYGKTNNGVPYTITLNKGQTYYLISSVNSQLAGTHIVAQGGKKIAVYVGSPNTHAPGGVSARDALFEQMMPIDYWGTQFIATRSLQKDGNIIGITATQNGTELKVDGFTQAYINEGETYYILLQGPSDPYTKNLSKIVSPIDQVITADAAYIETSCPAAVISYDTGNSFAGATGSEIVDGHGDPSSVWLSPIQQKINRITFGACYTKKTKAHFLNIVTETATRDQTTLTAYYLDASLDRSSAITWNTVTGNTKYSYARILLSNDDKDMSVFTLSNPNGFIAHVYGNGEDESYAYSVGSAAVEQGVNINGTTFTNGYVSSNHFCIDDTLEFNALSGSDDISRVDWDFGDGTSEMNGIASTKHAYSTPGWYDVNVNLYGHQVCTDVAEQTLGSVHFSFYVSRAETKYAKPAHDCAEEDAAGSYPYETVDTAYYGCDSIVIRTMVYGKKSSSRDTIIAQDSYTEPLTNTTYTTTQDIELNLTELLGITNHLDCDTILKRRVRIVTCLDMSITNDSANQHVCYGNTLDIPFSYTKGDIGDIYFILNEDSTQVVPDLTSNSITLPLNTLSPGRYRASLAIEDTLCGKVLSWPLNLAVYYPDSIFNEKFGNVLAVYAPGYKGNHGYNFTAYQWYRNNELIEGANGPVYHSDIPFENGDEYFVMLTDEEGNTVPSCPQKIEVKDTSETTNAPATKTVRNHQLFIIRDKQTYNIYGQRID